MNSGITEYINALQWGIRFEPVITVGTILQMILILMAIIGSWHKMDKILVDHEARIKNLERNAYGQYKLPELKYESFRKPGS